MEAKEKTVKQKPERDFQYGGLELYIVFPPMSFWGQFHKTNAIYVHIKMHLHQSSDWSVARSDQSAL